MKKIVIISFISILIIMLIIPTQIYAKANINIDYDKYKSDAASSSATTMTGQILGIIQAAGSILSVVILILNGIKFMLGSPEERFEYKQSMKLYLLGAFMIFAFSWIPNLIYNFVKDL